MPTLLEELILPATVLEQAQRRIEGQHSVAKFNGNLEALAGLQLAINILAGMAQDAALAAPAAKVAAALTAQALHAAEQCITDVLTCYKDGCANLVMDEAMKSLKNDGLKLVKAARKALKTPA